MHTFFPDEINYFTDSADALALVAKEHFVFTDPEGQLYHFSVEGNAIKDGTKIPAEANLCKNFCSKPTRSIIGMAVAI